MVQQLWRNGGCNVGGAAPPAANTRTPMKHRVKRMPDPESVGGRGRAGEAGGTWGGAQGPGGKAGGERGSAVHARNGPRDNFWWLLKEVPRTCGQPQKWPGIRVFRISIEIHAFCLFWEQLFPKWMGHAAATGAGGISKPGFSNPLILNMASASHGFAWVARNRQWGLLQCTPHCFLHSSTSPEPIGTFLANRSALPKPPWEKQKIIFVIARPSVRMRSIKGPYNRFPQINCCTNLEFPRCFVMVISVLAQPGAWIGLW
ncbi:hypothetical protein SCHPADRAFT_894739 [Schizopora paradoxa]|uniref:Uncharacterized protein n=1 Tax=Schizopora paradoxa TaxID=27342 RepID=A0A0H2R6C1_9AGAM|nr:hypothetical protein SCHPADRAFT_894739 [Schizopora paradoxa]